MQGVGFRPFVYSLAARRGLAGYVANDQRGVIDRGRRGPAPRSPVLSRDLQSEAPPLAVIERVSARELAPRGEREFRIARQPRRRDARQTLIAPDTATCADCLREMSDPSDRRYRYPFTNCTNCGPRFTIVCEHPLRPPAYHDGRVCDVLRCARANITIPPIAAFTPSRSHVPIAGRGSSWLAAAASGRPVIRSKPRPNCWLPDESSRSRGSAVTILQPRPPMKRRSAALRSRKHREDKPFAVMVARYRRGTGAGFDQRRGAALVMRSAPPDRAGPAPPRRGTCGCGCARQSLCRPDAAVHANPSSAVPADGAADGADQRQRVGRADRV